MEKTKTNHSSQGVAEAAPRSFAQQVKDCAKVKNLVKISVLGALGFVLMQIIHVPMPFAPSFMDVDFGDVPTLIGGFALGPVAGVLIQLVKNLLKLMTTHTVGVGELSNFILGASFVLVAASYYHRHRTMRGAVISLILGSLTMTAMGFLSNAFVIFPAFAKATDLDLNALALQVGSANPLVKDYWTLMAFAVVPFNLVKTTLESVACLILYKRISPILHK